MAIFVYPVMHEAGHLLATLVFGGSVGRVSVFPVAYTECDVFFVSNFGKAVTGLSGMIFPIVFGIPIQKLLCVVSRVRFKRNRVSVVCHFCGFNRPFL